MKHKEYFRHVEKLEDVINKREATHDDYVARAQGMKYKIFVRCEANPSSRNRKAYAYANTAAKANKLKTIVNRGLARWNWGSSIANDDLMCPKTFLKNTVVKSPHLSRYKFNSVTVANSGNIVEANITNTTQGSTNYLQFAKRKGIDNAERRLAIECRKGLELFSEGIIPQCLDAIYSSGTSEHWHSMFDSYIDETGLDTNEEL